MSIFGLPAEVMTAGTRSSIATATRASVSSGLPKAIGKFTEKGRSESSRKSRICSRIASGRAIPSMQPRPPALETITPRSALGVMAPMSSG